MAAAVCEPPVSSYWREGVTAPHGVKFPVFRHCELQPVILMEAFGKENKSPEPGFLQPFPAHIQDSV